MSEMIINIIIVALAVYGLTCIIRWIWSRVIKKGFSQNILVVPLYDDNLEFSLRDAVTLAKTAEIESVAAIDCGLSAESKQMALIFANSEPLVKIIDSSEVVKNIF